MKCQLRQLLRLKMNESGVPSNQPYHKLTIDYLNLLFEDGHGYDPYWLDFLPRAVNLKYPTCIPNAQEQAHQKRQAAPHIQNAVQRGDSYEIERESVSQSKCQVPSEPLELEQAGTAEATKQEHAQDQESEPLEVLKCLREAQLSSAGSLAADVDGVRLDPRRDIEVIALLQRFQKLTAIKLASKSYESLPTAVAFRDRKKKSLAVASKGNTNTNIDT